MYSKRRMSYLIIIYILLNFIRRLNCQSMKGEIDFIYSPFFQQKYDITDPQGASTKIKVAEKANLVFISAGFSGIIVLDGNTNEIIFQQKAQEFLFAVEATSDGEYVMMSYKSQFSIFKFVDRKQLVFMSKSDFPTSILDMFMDSLESTVYAVGLEGQLVGYSIINKNNIEKVGFYNSLSNIIHQGSISQDGNWILLGNDVNGLYVLKVIKNRLDNQQEYELAGQGINVWKTWAAVITSDNKYVYSIDNWNGVFICDFNQILSAQTSQYPVELTFTSFWPFLEITPSLYSLKLSKDNNYLFIGVRSQGVYIFDIKHRTSPIFFQSISVGAHAFSITLSGDEKHLYYANAQSIYIFRKTPPNLNNNYPNLFNIHQASQQNISPAFYKWRCYIKNINNKQYYFGPSDVGGLYIFDSTDPYEIKEIFFKLYQPLSLIDSLEFSFDNKYLYVPQAEDNTAILVLDITDVSNPVEVFRFKMDNPNHGESIFFSKDHKYMVLSYDNGVLLIDPSDPPKLVLLDYWHVLPYMTGENSGVMITNDNNWVIGAVRGYGLYLLDASIKNKLKFITSIQTLGAEGIIPSLYDNSYAYLYDGFKGVAIIDLKALPKLKILSRVSLQGWSNTLVPLYKDSFLLVAQMELGMVTLIDIQDKANPQIISTYQYQTQSAQSICLSPDEQYSFINNNLGSIVLPLRSKVLIHTEVQQILSNDDGSQTLISISKDQYLKVGQKIQFNFVKLFPLEGMSIFSVSYYEQQQIKPLPFWMKYDLSQRNLLLEIDKSALGADVDKPNLNTILLQIAIPLYVGDFIYDYHDVKTTEDQAQLIYTYLQEQNLITYNGIITELFKYNNNLIFQIDGIPSTERLFTLVKQTLQRGSYVNPVIFYVEPSLQLDIRDQNNPVKTLASSVQLFLTIDSNIGKFVLLSFTGVIASITDQQDQLKLEGSTDNLNRVLQQKVILANKLPIEGLNLTISLIDGVNYQVTQTQLISQCTFIKLKQQLKKNPLLRLQDQFSKVYKNNQVNIQEEFSIDFKPDSFIVSDIKVITYKAFILTGNEYTELSPDNWIQFETTSGSINFHGVPPSSVLNQIFNIRVTASDGYTSDSDEFLINASGLPFLYVFNLLIKIFGPIFAIFGVYKYKSLILNSLFRNVVMFSPETAVRSRMFKKKIPVLGDDNLKCKLLFDEFIRKFFSDKAKYKEEAENIKNTLQRYGSDLQAEGSSHQGNNDNQFNRKKVQSIMVQPECLQKQDDHVQNDYSLPRRLKVMMGKENLKLQNSIKLIQMSPKHNRASPIEIEYLKKDGNISLSKIIRDITHKNITFTLKGKKYSAHNFITDFKNRDSRIYICLRAIACRYFLKLDLRSSEIYSYIKYHAMSYLAINKKDWHKAIVNVQATDKKDCYGFPTSFPEITLKEEVLNLILIDLQIHNRIGQAFESIGMFDVNYNLIREVLFADALGLVEYTPSIFSPCVGESIHLHSYEIGSVEAFQQVRNDWCMGFRKLFNIEYMQYGMSKNMSLPNWINFDHKNGVIFLQGTPQSQDVEDLLIRIIDIDQYVIKQYHFNVVDEFCYEDDDQTEDNSFMVTLQDEQSQMRISEKKPKYGKQYSLTSSLFRDLSSSQLVNKPIKINNAGGFEDSNPSFFKHEHKKNINFLKNDASLKQNQEQTTLKFQSEQNKPHNNESRKISIELQHHNENSKETNQDLPNTPKNFLLSILHKTENQLTEQQYPIQVEKSFVDSYIQDKETEQNITSNRDSNTKRELLSYQIDSKDFDKDENLYNLISQYKQQNSDKYKENNQHIKNSTSQNNIQDQGNQEDIEHEDDDEDDQQKTTSTKIHIKTIRLSQSHSYLYNSITPSSEKEN